jgi:hypothetical protein
MGCTSSPSAPIEAPSAAAEPPVAVAPTAIAGATPPTDTQGAFQPPFPQREELFLPPDLSSLARLPDRLDGQDVVVRGFVNFQGQRVVLEINGAVRVLKEGEQHQGVEVRSIAPPAVSLQRGSHRWTLQLARRS